MKIRERLSYSNVMATLAVFIAIGGSATAALSGKDKKTVKKIAAGQAQLEIAAQAGNLSVRHANTAGTATTANSASPTGGAGGDLAGSYPSPSLRGADAVTLAGLADTGTGGDCTGLPPNNWYDHTTLPSTVHQAGYYRDRQGRVFLQGLVKACGAATGGIVFTLPPGFRPVFREMHAAVKNLAPSTLFIEVAGGVSHPAPVNGDVLALDGISFRCAPSGANGCP